ncbi:rho guanine nucleotide exchange factor 7 [Sergentomyia squamirostris]
METPYTVQAEYSFKGSNNDELCFKKGDIITVTQREEGGWWEGTLGDKTGWFPSNYVKEYKTPLPVAETIRPPEEIQASRSLVLSDLLESEKAHVAEIRGLLENFLEPLSNSQILSSDEYAQLMCNFVEIVEIHEDLLLNIEDCNDRVGKLFLSKASVIKNSHQAYCAAHPRAIVILDKFKDALETFMERQGAASPGLLVLTTGLSKPFRRLEKYSAMLQELERHMECGHPDRGDTQRSVAVYKDIAATCAATRRQKELELQVLTGPVRGWQGQELSTLGDIIHMGSVAVGPDHRDRYFVLFPQTLLILSVSQRMSAFIYEGKLPLTNIIVKRLEDSGTIKNAFELSAPLIERIVAVCQGPAEANKWVDLLSSFSTSLRRPGVELKRNMSSNSPVHVPQPPPHNVTTPLDIRGYSTRNSVISYNLARVNYRPTLPPQSYPPTAPYARLNEHFAQHVKKGKLSRYLVKALLYPEFLRDYDTSNIVLRRRHKTTVRMLRKKSTGSSSDRINLSRQDAFDCLSSESSTCSTGSTASNPFGLIRYFTGKRLTDDSRERTHYETFIDHGPEVDCTKCIFDEFERRLEKKELAGDDFKERKSLRIELKRSEDGQVYFRHFSQLEAIDQALRDSLVMCSKPVKIAQMRSSSGESVVHLSTARLNLAAIKQQSEASEVSSFEHKHPNGRMVACENLLKLDDSMPLCNNFMPKIPIDERHSMPSLLVGNRFNNSSSTEIYIPSWRDRQEGGQNKIADDTSKTTKHSTSIELPQVSHTLVPLPDEVAAEIMYNLNGSDCTNVIYKPPSRFASGSSDRAVLLNREVSPFAKHSINSDLKMRERSRSHTPRKSVRRCVSSHFVRLTSCDTSQTPDVVHPHECCCKNSTHSPRSSDSGMAGSYTIARSPEPSKTKESHEFFHSICDEDHRRLVHSRSSHNLGHFPIVIAGGRKSATRRTTTREDADFTDSGQYGDSSLLKDDDIANFLELSTSRETFETQIHRSPLSSKRSRSVEDRSLGVPPEFSDNTSSVVIVHLADDDKENQQDVFRAGLYAHWWKKEKLPSNILRGIMCQPRDGHDHVDLGDGSHGGGSGKKIRGMSPPPSLGGNHQSRVTTPIHMPQHKRSHSFNHHLTFNQLQKQQQQAQPQHPHPAPPLPPSHHPIQPKDLIAQSLVAQNEKSINPKANWSITNLRPAPPSRMSVQGGIVAPRKDPPTYEEDALVLRVIESYCAAYQSTSRTTTHSALQPWTPCLPIRGGKLKSSKHFSTSNPQLPFICGSPSNMMNNTNSTNSLNSSYIWREASPNNFNMYSTSVSSLNSYRYSLGTAAAGATTVTTASNTVPPGMTYEWRSVSEDKSPRHKTPPIKYKTASNYDNLHNTPLLSRKVCPLPRQPSFKGGSPSPRSTPQQQAYRDHHLLYDRRINRSFDAPGVSPELMKLPKGHPLRRSTPHLSGMEGDPTLPGSNRDSMNATWCCGSFVLKQWRKYHNYD